jgi:hypothetical protein
VFATASDTLNSTELYINAASGLISVWSSRDQVVGTHTLTVTALLTEYPTIAPTQTTLQLEILPCIVTGFTMTSISNKLYGIANPILRWSLVGTSITTQVPACGYSVNLVSSGEPLAFVNVTTGTTLTYSAFTRDLNLEGTSSITVTASLNSYPLGPGQTAQPFCSASFNLSAVDPCLVTTISDVPNGVENFVVFPGYPAKSL